MTMSILLVTMSILLMTDVTMSILLMTDVTMSILLMTDAQKNGPGLTGPFVPFTLPQPTNQQELPPLQYAPEAAE